MGTTGIQYLFRTTADSKLLCYAWFQAMHTRVDILISSSTDEQGCRHVVDEAASVIHEIELKANCFDPHSELSRVNRLAATRTVPLSEDLRNALQQCLDYHRLTDGLFDITTDSQSFSSKTGTEVSLSTEGISFAQPGIKLNMSGFIKGYALDRIGDLLRREGFESALVSLGTSSVMAIGHQHGSDGWRMRLPGAEGSIVLHDECLTTSGNDRPGRHHIINPKTGHYVEGMSTVSVVTESATVGEVMSTCLFIAPPAIRQTLIKQFKVRHWYTSPPID